MSYRIICPGCGWIGKISNLLSGACPICDYKNDKDLSNNRLLSVKEMLDCKYRYDNVRLDLFLKSLLSIPYEFVELYCSIKNDQED